MRAVIAQALATLLVAIDPIGVAPVVASMTHEYSPAERRRIVLTGTAIAGVVLFAFAVLGNSVLSALGISLAAFRIAGGVLLFMLAIELLFVRHSGLSSTTTKEQAEAGRRRDISVFPLAIPLIAGPGAITSVVLLMAETRGSTWLQGGVLLALLAVLAVTVFTLLLAAEIVNFLGVTGINVIGRVLGIVLAALAVQFVIDGIREVLVLPPLAPGSLAGLLSSRWRDI
jgi:multiple antibiotic resistance protein